MTTLLTSVCKYSMIIVMILYTVLAFWSLRYKSVENMRGCYWGMNLLTFSFLTLGFAVIAVKERNILIVGYYAAIMLYFMVYLLVYRHMYKKANFSAAKPYAYVFVNWFYIAYKAKSKTVNKAVYYSSRFLCAYTNSSQNVCKTEGCT